MELETALLAPESWTRLTIASICVRFTSGGTPSRQRPEYYVNGTIPWVKTQELSDWVLYDTEERITPDALAASSAKLLPPNTVLMAMYGATVGQLGILGREMACNQACAAMVIDPSIADYRFVFYQLLANRRQIKSLATGAAQQNLSGSQVKEFVLAFPSLPEQKAIADFLWTIDCRRALLRETNLTLESVAEAIFKSWFVDFEPVHAKAAGRDPKGMDAETAALFPSEFEDSELGPIPKGWKVGSLGELVSLSRDTVRPSDSPDVLFEHYSLPAYDSGQVPSREYGAEIKSSKTRVRPGTVLQSKLNPHIPRVWLPGAVGPNAVCSTEFLVWLPRKGVPRAYVYCLLKSRHFIEMVQALATGTSNSHQRVRPEQVSGLPIVIPTSEVLGAFSQIVEPLFQRVNHSREQSRLLTSLRDTLLPRLISGKLRIPEAEELVQEAVS